MSTVRLHVEYGLCTIPLVKNILSSEKYAELSSDEQFFYDPLYKKYKTKKVRDYQDCDLGHTHFMGWVEVRTPIGEPISYVRDNSLTRQTMKLMKPKIVDSLLESNVLMSRILSKPDKWKKEQ
jgi:hypothetical protein